MFKNLSRFAGILCLLMITLYSSAQDTVEMADSMRSNGKIYVVVAVSITILIGLFVYLIYLDRKISRYEKNK